MSEEGAKQGITYENTSDSEPLVILRYFGPEVNPPATVLGLSNEEKEIKPQLSKLARSGILIALRCGITLPQRTGYQRWHLAESQNRWELRGDPSCSAISR